jgi:NarL family two-component system response regulator LiaR
MTIRLVIADDHNVVRQALRLFLSLSSDLEVVGEAGDGAEAVRLVLELDPDVVLMDLVMPGMDGVTAIRAIREAGARAEIIALTSVTENATVLEAIRAGAVGYLLKNADGEELRRAVRGAAAREAQLSPEAAGALVSELRGAARKVDLSAREREVLQLIARGLANKEIALALSIGDRTVKFHVASLLAKLHVQSRTQAAMYAIRAGLAPEVP